MYESGLAAFPAIVLNVILDLLTTPAAERASGQHDWFISAGVRPELASEAVRIYEKIGNVLTPLWVPLTLLGLSWVAGWASLRRGDGTAASRSLARRAYLS